MSGPGASKLPPPPDTYVKVIEITNKVKEGNQLASPEVDNEMFHTNKVTKLEQQARQNEFDDQIDSMVLEDERKNDHAKRKSKTKRKSNKIKLRIGTKIHPENEAGTTKYKTGAVHIQGINDLSKKKKHSAKKYFPKILRLRANSSSIHFKFRPFDGKNVDRNLPDPLHADAINEAKTERQWMRSAVLGLPSNAGIPVENTGDVLSAGLTAIQANEKNDISMKDQYNNVYDEMQKHYSKRLSATTEVTRSEEFFGSGSSSSSSNLSVNSSDTSAVSYTKKLKALQYLAEHLTYKRLYKQELLLQGGVENEMVEKRSFKHRVYRFLIQLAQFKRDVCQTCTIWGGAINEIQGKFGNSAAAYFRWLRIILILNILYFTVVLVLIILPEMSFNLNPDLQVNTSIKCQFKPDLLCPNHATTFKVAPSQPFHFLDLLLGRGFLENSFLYYSGYQDTLAYASCPLMKLTSNDTTTLSSGWSITAFRFAAVLLIIFGINSMFIAWQITHFYHVAQLESRVPGLSKKEQYKVVLCTWDYNCSDPMAAEALHRNISRELKEMLRELQTADLLKSTAVKAAKGKWMKIIVERYGPDKGAMLLHFIATLGVILLCFIAGIILYFSFYIRKIWFLAQPNKCDPSMRSPEYMLLLPSIFISASTYAVTKICVKIATYETWENLKNQNYTLIARVGLYYITNIGVLYGYWAYQAKVVRQEVCYEELFGIELYRIVVFQGLIHIVTTLGYNLAYHYYKKRKDPDYVKPEFETASGALNMFFMHTISGFGVFFCPLISLLVIFRLILTFYNRKYTLLRLSSYPTHLAHLSQIAAPYLVCFFVSYFIVSCLNVLLIAELHPSSVCGPFSHFRYSDSNHLGYYWEVFHEITSRTTLLLAVLTKPGLTYVFISILISLSFIFRTWANAYVITMIEMHELLLLERKDRDYLLKAIFKCIRKQHELEASESVAATAPTAEEKRNSLEMEKKINAHLKLTKEGRNSLEKEKDVNLHLKLTKEGRNSLEKEKDVNVHLKTTNEGRNSMEKDKKLSGDWKTSELTNGIFNNRKGSIAKAEQFRKSLEAQSENEIQGKNKNKLSFTANQNQETSPHATFGRQSMDDWLQVFLKSTRAGRRDAVGLTESDKAVINKTFGISDENQDDKEK